MKTPVWPAFATWGEGGVAGVVHAQTNHKNPCCTLEGCWWVSKYRQLGINTSMSSQQNKAIC